MAADREHELVLSRRDARRTRVFFAPAQEAPQAGAQFEQPPILLIAGCGSITRDIAVRYRVAIGKAASMATARTAPGTSRWRQSTAGELLAECFGTFVLICFGDGVVAMAVAALNQSGRGKEIFAASGDWLIIGWGWGFAVTFGVYVAGGISGAHINPAVTVAFAARRGFPWSKVPGYIAAQLIGAFLGALLVYIVYKGAIDSYERANHIVRGDPSSVPTYSIFATFPAPYFGTVIGPLIDQIVGTAFLVAFVFAVTDEFNQPVKANLAPIAVGFIVVAIGLSFGANAGYAINPARDFGPRIFAWIAGWGKVAMPGDYGNISAYFWIPIIGPFVGGVIGAFAYDLLIRDVLIARGEVPPPETESKGRTVEEY
jgi:glycerol uptake facilitator protein